MYGLVYLRRRSLPRRRPCRTAGTSRGRPSPSWISRRCQRCVPSPTPVCTLHSGLNLEPDVVIAHFPKFFSSVIVLLCLHSAKPVLVEVVFAQVRCKKPEFGGLGFGPLEFGTHQRQGAPPFHLGLVFNCSNNLQDQAGNQSDRARSMYLLLSCSPVKPFRNQHLPG